MKVKLTTLSSIAAIAILFLAALNTWVAVIVAVAYLLGLTWYRYQRGETATLKRGWLVALIAFLVAITIVINLRFFSGEDTWICSNGQWVKHGNPSAPMPTTPCR